MKKFTLKDFILYNGPCFSCGSKIDLSVAFTDQDQVDHFLRPHVDEEYTQLDLHIGYVSTLRLIIFHQDNRVIASSQQLLAEYLAHRKLFLTTKCPKCGTWASSQTLQFELKREVLQPLSLRKEVLILNEGQRQYRLATSFETGETHLNVSKIIGYQDGDFGHPILDTKSELHITLPLLPLYQIKTRQQLLSKLKTYVVFS